VAVARVTKPPDVGKNVTRTDIPAPLAADRGHQPASIFLSPPALAHAPSVPKPRRAHRQRRH
jgi:hypothetical protein